MVCFSRLLTPFTTTHEYLLQETMTDLRVHQNQGVMQSINLKQVPGLLEQGNRLNLLS